MTKFGTPAGSRARQHVDEAGSLRGRRPSGLPSGARGPRRGRRVPRRRATRHRRPDGSRPRSPAAAGVFELTSLRLAGARRLRSARRAAGGSAARRARGSAGARPRGCRRGRRRIRVSGALICVGSVLAGWRAAGSAAAGLLPARLCATGSIGRARQAPPGRTHDLIERAPRGDRRPGRASVPSSQLHGDQPALRGWRYVATVAATAATTRRRASGGASLRGALGRSTADFRRSPQGAERRTQRSSFSPGPRSAREQGYDRSQREERAEGQRHLPRRPPWRTRIDRDRPHREPPTTRQTTTSSPRPAPRSRPSSTSPYPRPAGLDQPAATSSTSGRATPRSTRPIGPGSVRAEDEHPGERRQHAAVRGIRRSMSIAARTASTETRPHPRAPASKPKCTTTSPPRARPRPRRRCAPGRTDRAAGRATQSGRSLQPRGVIRTPGGATRTPRRCERTARRTGPTSARAEAPRR